jgi:hypothetical protein
MKTNFRSALVAVAVAASCCFTGFGGEFAVSVSPPKLIGQKALVKMEMVNHLAEPVSSVKAACFIGDNSGQVLAQGTRWVFGGGLTNKVAILIGGTNIFYFVINSGRPWTTTNLTAKVVFSRVVLQSGQLADPVKEVKVTSVSK